MSRISGDLQRERERELAGRELSMWCLGVGVNQTSYSLRVKFEGCHFAAQKHAAGDQLVGPLSQTWNVTSAYQRHLGCHKSRVALFHLRENLARAAKLQLHGKFLQMLTENGVVFQVMIRMISSMKQIGANQAATNLGTGWHWQNAPLALARLKMEVPHVIFLFSICPGSTECFASRAQGRRAAVSTLRPRQSPASPLEKCSACKPPSHPGGFDPRWNPGRRNILTHWWGAFLIKIQYKPTYGAVAPMPSAAHSLWP